MTSISATELRSTISGIMKGADLTTISSKKIRNQLEKKFKVDLTPRKMEIDEMIMSFVNDENDASEAEEPSADSSSSSESEDDQKSSNKKSISPPPKPKSKAVKKETKAKMPKDEVKAKVSNLSDSSADEMDDAVIARKLQEKEWSSRHRAAKKMPKETARQKKKDDGAPKVRKGTSLYTRKCTLSPELAAIMETDEMARPDVVKKMWSVVKERNLLDPANRQFAICDDQLKKIFGAKRVRVFGMMKYLKNHIKDIKV